MLIITKLPKTILSSFWTITKIHRLNFGKYVILKNSVEIASWIESENFSFGEEDNFKIQNDVDIEMVISLTIIIHLKECSKREA